MVIKGLMWCQTLAQLSCFGSSLNRFARKMGRKLQSPWLLHCLMLWVVSPGASASLILSPPLPLPHSPRLELQTIYISLALSLRLKIPGDQILQAVNKVIRYLSSNAYTGISLIMVIVSYHFIKWLIQFSCFNGISLYIHKANDRTSHALDTVSQNAAFSRGLNTYIFICKYKWNLCVTTLKATVSTGWGHFLCFPKSISMCISSNSLLDP